MPKLNGHLRIQAGVDPRGETYIEDQSFSPPFHLGKAYWDNHALLINVVNATAGILEGDSLATQVKVGPSASVLLTTPSASRIFSMRAEGAICWQEYSVGTGGWLEVMTEPLVPHRASQYCQKTLISVESGGELYFADVLAPGRVAHGESWEWQNLRVELSLRLAGELIYQERTRQSGEELKSLSQLAGMDQCWLATLLLVSPALDRETQWRETVHQLHRPNLRVGFSRLGPGAWFGRLIGDSSLILREALARTRSLLQPLLPRLLANPRKI